MYSLILYPNMGGMGGRGPIYLKFHVRILNKIYI